MEDIKITSENLDAMLERFFDGDTSRAEEQSLERYFRSAAPLPRRYECYRAMFGWYASGMKEEELPKPAAPVRRKAWRTVLWGSSVAAAVALVLCIVPLRPSQSLSELSCYEGSFIMRDGRLMVSDNEIRPEIEAALLDAACLEQEIDRRISMMETEDMAMADFTLE